MQTRIVTALTFGMALCAPAAMAQPTALPKFSVKPVNQPQGLRRALPPQEVPSSDLGPQGEAPSMRIANEDPLPPITAMPVRWLLVYVKPGCSTCAAVLQALQPPPGQLSTDRIVVIAGAADPALRSLTGRFRWIPDAAWFTDASHEASAQLGIKTDVTMFGMEDRTIVWRLLGSPASAGTLRSAVQAWIRDIPSPDGSQTR